MQLLGLGPMISPSTLLLKDVVLARAHWKEWVHSFKQDLEIL